MSIQKGQVRKEKVLYNQDAMPKASNLELHAEHPVHAQTLAHAEIQHDLFTSTGDSIGTDITVQSLDLSTLTTAAVTQTTEDLTGLAGTELEGLGGLGLEAGDGTTQLEHSLGLLHALALEDDVLEPVVGGFDLAGHVSELHADDRVVDQALPEGLALVGVLHGFLVADTGEAAALDDDSDALVVEVGHNDLEATVLLANQILDGNLDILEGHIGGSTAENALAVHAAGANTASRALDQKDTETVHAVLAGANSSGEVIGPDTICDPLLLTVDNVVLAILAELSLTAEISHITARIGLRDSQANALVTSQNAGQDTVNQLLLAEFDQRRATNTITTDQVPNQATASSAGQLVSEQHLMEQIPAVWRHRLHPVGSVLLGVLDTQQTGQVATLTHLLVDMRGDLLAFIPLGNVRFDLGLDPLANLITESGVRFVEVRRRVLSIARILAPSQFLLIFYFFFGLDLHPGTTRDRRTGSGRHTDPAARQSQGA